jgi:tetratricopeptide (TPR) repeat protein
MDLQRRLKLLIMLFVAILLGSFGVAGYLLVRSARQTTAQAPVTSVSDAELLARAEQYLRKQQAEQALVLYRRVLTSTAGSLEAQLGLARGELMAGREDMAAQEYERALELDRGNTTALLQLARIYSHRAKTWGLAEARFREYLALAPDDADPQLQLARVLFWQGKWPDAAEGYSRPSLAKRLSIQDRRDYVVALNKSGQSQRAELVLKRFLADGPQDFELKLQLASLYAARQDWGTALPLYRALLQERPNALGVNLTYGVGLLAAGDPRTALEPLAKARNGMPSSREAGLAYARALRGVKEYKRADKEYERVLPAYRTDVSVVREYADLLLEKRDYRKAEAYYKEAYDMGFRDVRLLVSLSGALRGNGKPRAALPYLEEAYRREPTDRLGFELAKLMNELGRTTEASQLLNTIEPASARLSR